MASSPSGQRQNDTNNKTVYDTPTTVNLLKALFENENYCFSSFSSTDHSKIVQETMENSQRQDHINPVKLNGDPILNEFVNNLYTFFGNLSSANNISEITDKGMIKYEICSIQSLNSLSSTTVDDKQKSIWLPKSMTIGEAHRILSTILYSIQNQTIPVDLADYVLIYENIMISLENQSKELYEEILKISFRLNRVALPPYRLFVIHKSQLLLLERKESKSLLNEHESISILQLIMFHLIANNIYPSGNANYDSFTTYSASSKDQSHEYWPINEVKMGIIPSSQLIHPLKHNKLRQIIYKIIQNNDLSIKTKMNTNTCIELLEKIVISVNGDKSHIKSITPSLSKSIKIYDYPLLIALPYDRLLLSQFCKTQCSDGRYAQGIMVNGKYYSLDKNAYTHMSELKINPGSIIQLRFNFQPDTILNGNISSFQTNQVNINEHCKEVSNVINDKFVRTGYDCSAEFDNKTVRLMFPSQAIDLIKQSEQKSSLKGINLNNTMSDYLKSSNNWIDSTKKMDELSIEKKDHSLDDHSLVQALQTTLSSSTLINKPSVSSLPLIDKPECSNCLSHLNDDNLECPHCTRIFCRACIESSCDNVHRDHYCPTCFKHVKLSEYRRSTIIGKFEKEGISALKCVNCNLISKQHRLCLDSNCSALFCYDCYIKLTKCQSSTTIKEQNSAEISKCPRCNTSDMYESGAVIFYSGRIIEYGVAQEVESNSAVSLISKPSPNTEWKQEDWLPEKGTLEENHNRVLSVIQFNGGHIQFGNKEEHCPLLIINEPSEYTCPESLRLSYWNTENEINRWEDDKKVQFYQYNQSSIAAYIPHFSDFTARNIRFTEHIMLDTAFLDTQYDYDFTAKTDIGKTYQRGPEPYTRPCGWYRKAIKVLDKYENAEWLGKGTDAWPVAYHGTATANALQILRNGLMVGGSNGIRIANGAVHGAGIYLSPSPAYSAHPRYSKPVEIHGRRYQIMFQVRVKSDSIRKHIPDIWSCPNSMDVRPYGILVKETNI